MDKPGFDAEISTEQAQAGEEAAQRWGVVRRTAYACLTRNSEQMLKALSDGGEGTAEALMQTAESIADYLKWREHETELLTAAQARLMLVLLQSVKE